MEYKKTSKSVDVPFWSLLLSNIAIIIWAALQNWLLASLIWTYWFQTLALSIFSCLRLLRFHVFLAKDIKIIKFNLLTKPEFSVKILSKIPSNSERIKTLWPPLFGLCFAHFIYYAFLVGEMNTFPSSVILLAGSLFLINQLFTFLYRKKKDRRIAAFIHEYESYNMLRIVPIHLTFVAAVLFRDFGISFESRINLLLFLFLKTAIDIGMYVCEGKTFREDFEQKNNSIISDNI